MRRTLAIGCLFLLLPLLASAQETLAIRAKRIVTVGGPAIENGVVIVSDGRIQKLGADLSLPAGCRVLDFADGWLYPGLINSMSGLGITGVGFGGAATDRGESGDFNPEISAYTAFYPWSNLIPIARDHGTLVSLTTPSGGMVSGKAVLASLSGWIPEEMFLAKEAALIVQFPESRTGRPGRPAVAADEGGQLSKKKKDLVDFFTAARTYHLKIKSGLRPAFNAKFEAMRPLWEKKLPVIISVNLAADIRQAIMMARDLDLKFILAGCYEAETVLKEIKESGAGVILPSLYAANRKWEDGYDRLYRLPASLHEAGIKIAFSHPAAATAFDLPIQAARSIAYGLPADEVLKGLTLYPAEMLGLSSHGSIAPGKAADLVVTSGDILDTATVVRGVLVRGKPVTETDYFRHEYEKARNRISGETR